MTDILVSICCLLSHRVVVAALALSLVVPGFGVPLAAAAQGQGAEGEDGPGGGEEPGDGPGDSGGAGQGGETPRGEDPEDRPYKVVDSPFEELESACVEERDGEACLKAGWAWKQGTGLDKPDPLQAKNLFEAGCVFDNAASCVALGRMYLAMEAGMQIEMPKGTVSLDFGAGAQAFSRACRQGLLAACGLWGDLYAEPKAMLPSPEAKARNIQRDLVQATQAWTLGCNEVAVPQAAGIPGDPPRADTRSCVRLAEFHALGVGGFSKNEARAADYYERACMASDSADYCKKATLLRAYPGGDTATSDTSVSASTGAQETEGSVAGTGTAETKELESDDKRPMSQRTAQPRRPKPKVGRFDDPDTSMQEEKKLKPIRFEFELAVGARWTYGVTSASGLKWRAGVNLWFWLFGLGLETGFHADKLFRVKERNYARSMHTLSGKFALPLPIELPIPARMYIVVGAGPTLGSMALDGGDFMFAWGAREMAQLVIVTLQERGARQWGAVRFEQQQSWHAQTQGAPEHASQVVLVFGFTFGGWGPTFRRGEQSRPTHVPLALGVAGKGPAGRHGGVPDGLGDSMGAGF